MPDISGIQWGCKLGGSLEQCSKTLLVDVLPLGSKTPSYIVIHELGNPVLDKPVCFFNKPCQVFFSRKDSFVFARFQLHLAVQFLVNFQPATELNMIWSKSHAPWSKFVDYIDEPINWGIVIHQKRIIVANRSTERSIDY